MSFEERGPVEDPSLLLLGNAKIGNARVRIVAIRMSRHSGRIPDYRSDISAEELGTVLETVLEECEYIREQFRDILVDSGSDLVEFPTGSYILMIVPATESALE